MRRTLTIRTVLLALALLLLWGGASGAVYADGAPDDTAAIGWSVGAKDAEGADITLDTAEDVSAALGKGFALDFGKNAQGEPVTAPTAADLRRSGVTVTPPEGYAVGSVMLVAEGASPAEGSRSLLALARASINGSGSVTLPAAIFAQGFDASAVGCVFNGSGDTYVLRIALERIVPPEQITLTYTAGSAASALGETALVSGGNAAVFPIEEGTLRASGTIAALSDEAAAKALSVGKQFAGWKLTLPDGSSAKLEGGESFSLSVSATLEAQWEDAIVFTFTGGEKMYDGKPLTGSYTQAGSLKDGDELSIPEDAFTLSRIEAGESDATLNLSLVRVLRGGENVTGEYDFVVVPAKLHVVRRGVTFTVTDVQKEYDGSVLEPNAYTFNPDELAEGHVVSADYSGRQLLPGISTGSADFTISDADGVDVTANYDVSVINGKITVLTRSEKQAITVTVQDLEKVYDGSAELSPAYSLTDGSLLGSDRLVARSFSGSVSGTGTGTVSGSFAVLNDETDLSDNYEITVVPGKLTVKPIPITLTADSAEKDFDNTPLTKDSFTVTSGKLLGGHSVTATVNGSQTKAGSSSNKIVASSVKITDSAGEDVSSLYQVTLADGTLTVNALPEPTALTVTMKSAEKNYDGKALTSKDYEITSGALAEGDKLVLGKVIGELTAVGEGSVTANFTVQHGETDVTSSYNITVVPGKLTIKPRPITLTADSAEKDFDGTALTKDGFTVTSGSVLSGHTVTATVNGSQIKAGSSANKIDDRSVKVTDSKGKNVTGLYSIRLVDGTLTVKAVASPTAITITMKDAEKVYDGKELSSKDYEITSGALAEGDKLVLGNVTGKQTDAGSSSVTAVFTVQHGKADVTANYTITVTAGKLTVKPREITVTAASASKIYDGRPLTSNSYKITSGELVKGHKLTASVAGSQTELGSSANMIDKSSVKITDGSGKDVTANYSVTVAAGTLTVNRDPVTAITLTVGDGSKVYDGKPYTFLAADIRVTSGKLPAGYKIEAAFNPEAPVNVGKYDVTIKSVTIRNASGADVTSQFNISRVKGTFTITPRPLTIETKAANKVYDGKALTERSTPTITGRAEGHQVTLRITGTQTKVGSSENTVSDVKITDKESGADVTKNYEISYRYGLLTVSESSGDDGSGAYSWVSGSSGTLYIRFDHSYDGFEALLVDGKELDRSAYTSASGSTDIWLKASYLNTLSSGEHTLTVKYSGGETVKTGFSVQGKQSSTRTGDSSRLGLWLVILALALAASFAAAWFLFLGKDLRWKKRPAKKNK